jgi:hypothetical protein
MSNAFLALVNRRNKRVPLVHPCAKPVEIWTNGTKSCEIMNTTRTSGPRFNSESLAAIAFLKAQQTILWLLH